MEMDMNAPLDINRPTVSIRDTLIRSLVCYVVADERKANVGHIAKLLYPNAPEVIVASLDLRSWYKRQIEKAVTNPAATSVANWAAELSGRGVAGLVAGLSAPVSAYSKLAERGIALDFEGVNVVAVPGRAPGTIPGFFVQEGAPIPVVALSLSGATAQVFKGGVISYFSGTLAKYSTPSIEDVIRQQLAIDAALSIDAAMLSADAASLSRPAGLLNGVTETAHATGGTPTENFAADLGNLAAAINTPVDLVYIVSATDYPKAVVYGAGLGGQLISSPALAAKTLIAIDAAYFYSCEDSENFQIDTSREATLVTSDTPTAITDAAGVRGKPTQSAFQADLVAVRLIADVAFGMSRSGRVSFTTGVEW